MATKLSGATCSYTLGATLGVGEYGKAIKCNRDDDGAQVVVKQVHISALSPQEQADAINEVRVMQELDHLNIVKYIECMQQDGYLYIVMEYCCYGELSGLIANRAKAHRPFTEQEIMFWFVQIALGLWHVHSKNILHRDLKTQNIFISKGGILKLGDFGISRVLNSDTELAKTAIGTPYYLSPEICQDMPYNRKSDVWALGCVLYELATLRRAFTGGSLPALVVKILKGQYPPLPARYSSHLRALVDSLLQQDPRVRPSIDAVLRLDYVKGHLARYAQHVVRLTTGPAEPGMTPKGLSAATSAVETHEYPAAAAAREETQTEQHSTAPPAEAEAAASERPVEPEAATDKPPVSKKASASRLRVPLPGFLRKKKVPQDKQQSQQLPPPAAELPEAAVATQQGQQSSSLRDRIRSSLSSSSGSGGDIKDILRRSPSNGSEAAHEDKSQSDLGQSQGSSTGRDSYSNSRNNSCKESAGSSSSTHVSQQPPHMEPSTASATDANGDNASGYDSSSSPSPTDDSRGQRRQRKKLIGTSWIEQQQLALARLQADLAASPAVRGKPQGPQQPTTEVDSAGLPLQVAARPPPAAAQIVQQVSTPAQQPLRAGILATPSPQVFGKAAGSAAAKPLPSSSSKIFARKAGSKGSRGGTSSSPADVVAAARKARLAERASWQEQQARAAADDAVRRAARAAELAAASREKAEAAHKAEEAGHALVAAHRQHLKAVQPRVNKSQLAELGAAFRQRLEVQGDTTAAAVTAEGGYQLPDAPVVPLGVKILQQSAGGSALLLDLSEAGFGPVATQADSSTKGGSASSGKLQSRSSNSKPTNAVASGSSASRLRSAGSDKRLGGAARSGGGSYSRSNSANSRGISAAAGKQGSRRSSAEGESSSISRVKSAGRAGLQAQQPASKSNPPPAAAAADKPWRTGKHIGLQRGAEPAIEIFAPYGSDCTQDQQEQHSLQQPGGVQEFTLAGQLQRTANAPSALVVNDSQISLQAADNGATPPTSPQVVNVLHTIQAALRPRTSTQASSGATATAGGRGSRPDSGAAGASAAASGSKADRTSDADSLELPPEPAPAADQLPSTAVRGWGAVDEVNGTAAVPVAQKIEALRLSLQQSLGTDAFMLAYRYMSAMHASPAEGEGEDSGSYEVLLFELLGPEKVHFVHLIHKLLMLENQTYAR